MSATPSLFSKKPMASSPALTLPSSSSSSTGDYGTKSESGSSGDKDGVHRRKPPLQVLFISGSLRTASANRGLLRAAAKLVSVEETKDAREVEVIYPNIELPFYDGDLESKSPNGRPSAVQTLWDQFHAADAVLIATPEYNGSMPPVLKNALDWMTRTTHGCNPLATFGGLPIGVMTAAGGGGSEVQEVIRKFILRLKAKWVEFARPIKLLTARAPLKFDSETGDLVDTTVLPDIDVAVKTLIEAASARYHMRLAVC